MSSYLRLALMVATSVVLMYGITYLQSAEIVDHAYLSESRAFVSLMMGAVMTVVMLLWMPGMYSNRSANIAIILGCAVAFERCVLEEHTMFPQLGLDPMLLKEELCL